MTQLFDTAAWANIDGKLVGTHFPGCEKHKFKSPPYFECVATHLTFSIGNVGEFEELICDKTLILRVIISIFQVELVAWEKLPRIPW